MPRKPAGAPVATGVNDATAAAAVSVLQAELGLVNGAIDALDRKAALIPPLLVAAAAFLIGPVGTHYNGVQTVLVIAATITFVGSSYYAYRALAPFVVRLGPRADILDKHLDAPVGAFNERVVAALSEAVQETSRTTLVKGERLSVALVLAGFTLVLLVLARVAGGLFVADNPQAPSSPAASAGPSASPAASDSPAPASVPATAPATVAPATPSAPPVGNLPLPSFGQQEAQRSASDLPSFGQQIAAKGGPLPDLQKRIIEKGG